MSDKEEIKPGQIWTAKVDGEVVAVWGKPPCPWFVCLDDQAEELVREAVALGWLLVNDDLKSASVIMDGNVVALWLSDTPIPPADLLAWMGEQRADYFPWRNKGECADLLAVTREIARGE